jgi:hypothetical protein
MSEISVSQVGYRLTCGLICAMVEECSSRPAMTNCCVVDQVIREELSRQRISRFRDCQLRQRSSEVGIIQNEERRADR